MFQGKGTAGGKPRGRSELALLEEQEKGQCGWSPVNKGEVISEKSKKRDRFLA